MFKHAIPGLLALSSLAAIAPCTAQAADPGLRLSRIVGGEMRTPRVSGDYVYIPTGRSLATWNYRDPAAPRLLDAASTPASGVIQGLARRGGYLYASWRAGSCEHGGVAVYSLADPARPRLVNEIADYAGDVGWTCTAGLAITNNRLYLFDTDNGAYVGSLADPQHPVFAATGIGYGPADLVAARGDLVWTSGRNWIGGTVIRTFDVGVPDAPVETAIHVGFGAELFSANFAPPYAIGFGWNLSVFDISDPNQIQQLGSAEAPYGAATGVKLGDHVYAGGFRGLDVWSIADPTQPVLVRNAPVRSFAAHTAVPLKAKTGLMLGGDDRILAIDARRPDAPRLASTRLQPGGGHARDIAVVGSHALLLQQNYGMSIADRRSLLARERFEVRLPEELQARDFEDWTVVGDLAYLLAWGYGLIVVDISQPLKPVEIGRLAFGGAGTLTVDGDYAFIGKGTNGQEMAVVDVSDPRRPRLLARVGVPDRPGRLQAHGDYVYSADVGNAPPEPGGLRVFDVTRRSQPLVLSVWKGDCESASDLHLDTANARLYLACRTGLRILDVSDPAAPTLIGGFDPETTSTFGAVALRGDRAWFGNGSGIYELDVSDPALPSLVHRTDMAGYEPIRLRAVPDGRVFAFTYEAGIHILDRPLGAPTR